MIGFSILSGPLAHLKHLFSSERLPFTAAYFGSLILTLFFALVVSFLSLSRKKLSTDEIETRTSTFLSRDTLISQL